MASTYVPLESWAYPAFERLAADPRATVDIALRPEWQLRLDEPTEWWHFPLLSAASQHNAAFTLQLSYRPIGGAK
jgi:hypothetical protein